MNLLIIGATGKVGRRLCAEALQRGHSVRAFARHPESAPEGAERVKGNVLLPADVQNAIHGVDAVLSAFGGEGAGPPTFLQSFGMRHIVQAAVAHRVGRIVAVADAGLLSVPGGGLRMEQIDFPESLKGISEDHLRGYRILKNSLTEWTLFCPPRILDEDDTGGYQIATRSLPAGAGYIRAGSLACAMLDAIESALYPRERVGLNQNV